MLFSEILAAIDAPDDQRLLASLYETYYPQMAAAIYMVTREKSTIEDRVNDTALRLVPHLGKLRSLPPPAQKKYVVLTARSTAIDHMRRQSAHWRFYPEEEWEQAPDPAAGPEDALEQKESRAELHEAIDGLSARDHDLICFRYFLDMTDEDLCRTLGIRPASIYQCLSRARKRLRALLEGGMRHDA